MTERRRGSDKISALHMSLIIASFSLLALNIILSWASKIMIIWYPELIQISADPYLYILTLGVISSANLYKFPGFLSLIKKNGNTN